VRHRSKSALNIASRVREFRKAAGLTQEDVGTRSDTDAKTISRIENGHTNPSIELLARIVESGIGVPLSGFFRDGDPSELRSDIAKLESLFASQSTAVRRRAIRLMRALCED
jgi:transcriptional regulator with XRE-family HTH domain